MGKETVQSEARYFIGKLPNGEHEYAGFSTCVDNFRDAILLAHKLGLDVLDNERTNITVRYHFPDGAIPRVDSVSISALPYMDKKNLLSFLWGKDVSTACGTDVVKAAGLAGLAQNNGLFHWFAGEVNRAYFDSLAKDLPSINLAA